MSKKKKKKKKRIIPMEKQITRKKLSIIGFKKQRFYEYKKLDDNGCEWNMSLYGGTKMCVKRIWYGPTDNKDLWIMRESRPDAELALYIQDVLPLAAEMEGMFLSSPNGKQYKHKEQIVEYKDE